MYRTMLLALIAASVARPDAARAQVESRQFVVEPGRAFSFAFGEEDRAVIGVTTSTGSARDTLGVLVSSVVPGGPAEKAGIEEGSRLAAINGVNLKLSPADAGDPDMAAIMSRRVTRVLGKMKPGDDVELRVYSGGQTRTVKVRTVSSDSLYKRSRDGRLVEEQRAALGIGLGSGGSKRDTLGVLVVWLDDQGPAAKAGMEEGNRVASINGVDLRVSREDAGDAEISGIKARRLQRELDRVKPGDSVTLRVYGEGRTRDLKLKTVAASTLRGRGHPFIFGGEPWMRMPAVAPMPPMPRMPPMREIEGRRVRISRVTI